MKTHLLSIVFLCTVGFGFPNSNHKINHTYSPKTSFTFVEGNITFAIFPNGEFDFYIQPQQVNVHANFGGLEISYNNGYNYNRYIQYDNYGAIVQIEHVPVFYDYYGRVKRIGNIQLNYYNNRLRNIGNLQIFYRGNGYYSHHIGYVNYHNRKYAYHPYSKYFTKPMYNNCVVSYQPYRKYYKPNRYNYHKWQKKQKYHAHKPKWKVDRRIASQKHVKYNTKRNTNRKHAIHYENTRNKGDKYVRNSSRKKGLSQKYYATHQKKVNKKNKKSSYKSHTELKKKKRNTYQHRIASRN